MATITYARVVDGAVAEPPTALDASLDPAKIFSAAVAAQLVAIPAAQVGQVAVGWVEGRDASDAVLFTAPSAAIAPSALLDYAGMRQDAVLAEIFAFNVAPSGQPAHTVTTRLDAKGQFAMLKVQGWLQLNAQTAGASMPYSNVDFSATTLSVAEADSLVEQAAALDAQSYAILNQVSAGITATPPTITSFAQVDAAFAALAPAATA